MLLDSEAALRLAPRLLSFHDFVEEALFDPTWGYYSTGAVRFGDGGDFDTFPIALSPYFGRMVAARAHRLWRGLGCPAAFEICEVGAGNGQLALDALVSTAALAVRRSSWRSFDRALCYRIIEKSPALRRRQRAHLGALAARVTWDSLDLSRSRRPKARGAHGFVVANEVLDCLAHHKVVLGRDRVFRVVFVGASVDGGEPMPLARMRAALARRQRLRFREYLLPVTYVHGLPAFLQRHYADVTRRLEETARPWTYFACPATEVFVANAGALYRDAEVLLIDYGGDRSYHLHTPSASRVSAGRPEERRATPYRAPGQEDITFLVDFSVAMTAAREAKLRVLSFAPQGRLAALAGMRVGARAEAEIMKHRALAWVLAVSGVGPEHRQRSAALSWSAPRRKAAVKSLAQEVREAVEEFNGQRPSAFQLLLLRTGATRS